MMMSNQEIPTDHETIIAIEETEPINSTEVFDTIDFVLVYWKNTEKKETIDTFVHNLSVNGLKIQFQEDEEEELVFVLLNIPSEKCLEVAENIKFKLPIEEIKFTEPNPISIGKNQKLNFFEEPRNKFTAPYNSKIHSKFEKYFNKNDPEKTFKTRDRILFTYEILSRTHFSKKLEYSEIFSIKINDQKFGIERLLSNGVFLDAYPLHQDFIKINSKITKRKFLLEYWLKPRNWFQFQPVFIIRKYFGERVAFYFAWLGFYTSWLIVPSIVGILVSLYGYFTFSFDVPTKEICDFNKMGNTTMCPVCKNELTCQPWKLGESCFYSKISYLVDNPFTVLFSVFMSMWSVLFIEIWKRKQSILQFEWDVIDFEKKNEPLRPQFENQAKFMRKNQFTGEDEPYVPFFSKIYRYAFSISIVLLMICLVVALVIGYIVYRLSLMMAFPKNTDRNVVNFTTNASAACINLFLIVFLNRFYSWLAVKLNDFELHRTDSKYEKALTMKMYMFQFVNYYASIFYIAFFKGKFKDSPIIEKCDQSGCLSELCIQLAIIMIGKQIFNNFQEVLYPVVQNFFTRLTSNKKSRNKDVQMKRWLKDYYLVSWYNLTLFDEYLEMVIQFGFITIFAVAFPLGPLFALINNIVEIRIDAFKILTQYKRPIPKKGQDIGIWLPILNTIAKLAVITNGLIIAFTSEFIPRLVYKFGNYNGKYQSLEGYVNFTLSKDYFMLNGTKTDCYYRDFRFSYDSDKKYEHTAVYYQVLSARLIFLAFFENVVFFIVTFMHWIPNVPKIVLEKLETENLISQRALWEIQPEKTFPRRKTLSAFRKSHGSNESHVSLNDIGNVDE